MGDHPFHVRTQDLDRDLVPAVFGTQPGKMHLRHRGAGYRRLVEFGEHLVRRPPVGGFDLPMNLFRRKRRHAILELRQFIGDVQRQQVAASGQHLPELDEDRAQFFQEKAEAHGSRLLFPAAQMQKAEQRRQPAGRLVLDDQLVDAVAIGDAENLGEAEETHGPVGKKCKTVSLSRFAAFSLLNVFSATAIA